MKMTPWMVSLAVLPMVIFAGPAAPSDQSQRRPGLSVEFFRKNIDLDAAQGEKMQVLLFQYDKETTKKMGDIQYQELELKDLLNSDDIDFDKLEAKFKEISALRADLQSYRIVKLLEARQFLKDEQYVKYKAILLQMYFQQFPAL